MPITCDAIIERARTGDHTAYASLVERHGSAVYGRIARQVNDPDDVKDLVQEVFIVVFTRLDQLHHPNRFPQWLMTVTDNTVRSWLRRRYTRLRNEDLFESESVAHSHEEEFPQQRMMIRRAIAKLNGVHRQVVVHHYLNGYSYRTIAGLLGVNENTVRSRLQKARTHLKREVIRMGHTAKTTQTLRLDATDLRAMRWATSIVSKDQERAALGSLYLDNRGFIVATDGHRMLVQASPTMKTLSQSILLAAWYDVHMTEASEASLQLKDDKAILSTHGASNQQVEIMKDAQYPDYPRVIPDTWSINTTVAVSDMCQIMDLLPDHLGPRHPVTPDESWDYKPAVEIRLSMPGQNLALLTTRDMGYSRGKGDETEVPPYDPVGDWTFTSSIPAHITCDTDDDPFRMWVDYDYLKTSVGVYSDGQEESVIARFNTSETAMIIDSPGERVCRMLLMPLRMRTYKPAAADETVEAAAS